MNAIYRFRAFAWWVDARATLFVWTTHTQKAIDLLTETRSTNVAFPNREHAPSQLFEGALGLCIASDVSGELRTPIGLIGRWLPAAARTIVLMPEATVDENNGTVFRQHQVGSARQIAAMDTESVSKPVDEASHGDFGTGIPSFDAGHDGAAFFGWISVGHSPGHLGARREGHICVTCAIR